VVLARKNKVALAPIKKVAVSGELDKADIIRFEYVPMKKLRPYYKNANIGDVGAIAESMDENGVYSAPTVNIGTKTGRPYEILVGNHRYLAARANGDTEIGCLLVDVGNVRASKVNASDNATARKSKPDHEILLDQLTDMPDLLGSGYNQTDVDAMLKFSEKMASDALKNASLDVPDFSDEEPKPQPRPKPRPAPEPEMDDDDEDDYEDDAEEPVAAPDTQGGGIDLERVTSDLPGVLQLQPELNEDDPADRAGPLGIPALREDMLATLDDIPDHLKVWAGSASKDDPDNGVCHWLYNYRINSTAGMADLSKMVVAHYTHDDNFENVFYQPAKFAAKLLNSGVELYITPNYSQWASQPTILNLWALYRARYVGRYIQNAGIKVVPDICWPMGDLDYLRDHVLATLPENVPVISIQLNTFDSKTVRRQQRQTKAAFDLVFETVKPDGLLLYGSTAAQRWFEETYPEPPFQVKFVETHLTALHDRHAKRAKSDTL
jgi:hypothetical protein